MFNQIIADLCAHAEPVRTKLEHGAWLDWQPKTRTLTAERINRRVDDKEATTFERFICVAGFDHTQRTTAYRDADAKGINTWMGVAWVLTPAKPAKAQVGCDDVQPSLFSEVGQGAR